MPAVEAADGLTPVELAQYEQLDDRPLHRFDENEFATYIELRRRIYPSALDAQQEQPGSEVAHFARKAIGQPFRLHAGIFELGATDCVTHVERSLAAGCARDWAEYEKVTKRLRHKEGGESFLQRNFFPLSQWVPNNAWLLEDITDQLFESPEPFAVASYPKRFYAALDFGADDTPLGRAKASAQAALAAGLPEKAIHHDIMIPIEQFETVAGELLDGDIVLFIREKSAPGLAPWLYCDHMGVIAFSDGAPKFVHTAVGGVREDSVTDFQKRYRFVKGVKVLRINEEAANVVDEDAGRQTNIEEKK